MRRCLSVISSLWDHDLRKRPFSNPKNTCFWFSHELWSLLFDAVICSPSLVFLSFPLKPPLERYSCITSSPSDPQQTFTITVWFIIFSNCCLAWSLPLTLCALIATIDLSLDLMAIVSPQDFMRFKPPLSICLSWSDSYRITRSPISLVDLHHWLAPPDPMDIAQSRVDYCMTIIRLRACKKSGFLVLRVT